jgi:hypothetical protein
MDEHGIVRRNIIPDVGFAPTRKVQRIDAAHAITAEFEVAFFGGKRDRKRAVARDRYSLADGSGRH